MMTVAELIAALQKLPQDAPAVIEDADTGWALHINSVEAGVGDWSEFVVIGGDYGHQAA